MAEAIYKLRRTRNTFRSWTYALTVPAVVGEMVPPGVVFTCEATDEGILFRPQPAPAPLLAPVRPAWMN